MVSKPNFSLATVSLGCQGKFLLGNRQSWLPTPISAWQPSVIVAKANFSLAPSVMIAKPNFCLETVSYGFRGKFLLGNRQSWFPRQISAWQPSVKVSKANFCLATGSHGCKYNYLLCNHQSCMLSSTLLHNCLSLLQSAIPAGKLSVIGAKTNLCPW